MLAGVTPNDEDYYGMIVEGRPNDEEKMIYKYLNMNFTLMLEPIMSVVEPWLSAHGDLMGE